MLSFFALLLQAGSAPVTPPRDIVVTARPLDVTGRALAECRARNCPPDEEARAALAHAENQFVAGTYEAARQTLQGTINRIKGAAKTYPVPVADVLRANSRIDLHLGESALYRYGQIDSLNALKAGLPATDGRVLIQRIEVVDADARTGRFEDALRNYAIVANDAHAAGQAAAEGYARLRLVVLLTAISNVNAGYETDLRQAVRWFDARPDLAGFATAARTMELQHFARKGDPAAVDRLIAAAGRTGTTPRLLYAPTLRQQDEARQENQNGGSATNALAPDDYAGQWADVSFWVTPDGKVSDIDVLRGGPRLRRDWLKPVITNIAARRYAPLAMEANAPGVLRVERYTLTAFWTATNTGSRIRARENQSRIEMLDLTAEPATPG